MQKKNHVIFGAFLSVATQPQHYTTPSIGTRRLQPLAPSSHVTSHTRQPSRPREPRQADLVDAEERLDVELDRVELRELFDDQPVVRPQLVPRELLRRGAQLNLEAHWNGIVRCRGGLRESRARDVRHLQQLFHVSDEDVNLAKTGENKRKKRGDLLLALVVVEQGERETTRADDARADRSRDPKPRR